MVLISGAKFDSNVLQVYVLKLLTIKIQTGRYFNEVLLVTHCSKSAKKTLSIVNNIISRLFWNLGFGIGIVNFFRYLGRIFWNHLVKGVLKFLYVTFLPLGSKSLKNICKGVNYLVGAVHRPVTYSNLMFFSGACPGFDSFCYFLAISKNNYLCWTYPVTSFGIYICLHWRYFLR